MDGCALQMGLRHDSTRQSRILMPWPSGKGSPPALRASVRHPYRLTVFRYASFFKVTCSRLQGCEPHLWRHIRQSCLACVYACACLSQTLDLDRPAVLPASVSPTDMQTVSFLALQAPRRLKVEVEVLRTPWA